MWLSRERITAAGFQFSIKFIQRRVIYLNFGTAFAADQMVVFLFGNLVDQMAVAYVGRVRQSILGQEFERAVDGRFGQAGDVMAGLLVYFTRREMPARMIAKRAGSPCAGASCGIRVRAVEGCIGYRKSLNFLIAKSISNILYQEDMESVFLTKNFKLAHSSYNSGIATIKCPQTHR